MLALGLLIARAGGHLQRTLAAVLLGLPAAGPRPIRRRKPGPVGVLTAVLADPGCWRAVSYHCLKILLAPFTFAFAVAFYAAGLGGLTYWIWQRYLPYQSAADGSRHRGMQWWPDYFVDTVPRMILLAAVGLVVLLLAPMVVRFFTTIDRVLIASLLCGPGPRADSMITGERAIDRRRPSVGVDILGPRYGCGRRRAECPGRLERPRRQPR